MTQPDAPKHSGPKEWKLEHDADGDYVIFEGSRIVAITDSDTDFDAENANLILAAPAMQEALREFVAHSECHCDDSTTRDCAFCLGEIALKQSASSSTKFRCW